MNLTSRHLFPVLHMLPASLALLLLASTPALAADRQVSVTGTCQRALTPDRGSVVLTAEFQDKDLKIASQRASENYEKVRDAVRKLGLENLELKTVEYSLNEVREWEKDRQVMKGYRARLGLGVATSNTQRLGEVMAIASREGIKDVGALTLFLSAEKLQQEQFACLQSAAENARAKADRLASSLGAKVGETLSINETSANNPSRPEPGPREGMGDVMAMKASREMAPPHIEAGQQNLSLNVNVTFSLK